MLDAVHFPPKYRWTFPQIKVAAAIGLFSVYRLPARARLTTALLTVYFALAVGFRIRPATLAAAPRHDHVHGAVFAATTARGLSVSSFTARAAPLSSPSKASR